MNKKHPARVLIALISIGVGVLLMVRGTSGILRNSKDQPSETSSQTTSTTTSPAPTASTPDRSPLPTAQTQPSEPIEPEATSPAQSQPVSRYITLADYNNSPSTYASQKRVYFFHASWCPICQSIHGDITTDPSQIPEGTTFIKTDFDDNTALRQKYGVTYQYTFVQVDSTDNEVKQWSATNLSKAIAGIQ